MSTEHHCILKDSFTPCSVGPLINLGCLDGASESGGMVSKTSWIILSRLGYDFLNTNLSQMNLCSLHYKEYFEEWIPNDGCVCEVKCIVKSETKVSLLLAVKVLRSEGKVLPIGRPLCESCQVHYEKKYAAKPGERVMIILKKRKPQLLSIKKEEPIDVKPSFIDLVSSDQEDEYPMEKRLRTDDDLVAKEGETTETIKSPQMESKYYCKLCKITFYKESSYRLHKKTSLELHNRIKLRIRSQKQFKSSHDEENDDGWKCTDCFIAFKDGVSMQIHMAEVHFTAHHPFHCKSCNYIFKNQSAFKSHNSRMHVSRIDKVYYCRECDDTFACKLKHARHILIHRPWNGDPDALQCKACGKVFTKHQTTSYNKHIKYHNQSEFNEDCSCYDCSLDEDEDSFAEEEDVDNEDSPFPDEESEDEMEGTRSKSIAVTQENLSKPFQCSICPIKFGSPKELEEHVANGVHEEYSVNGLSELDIKTEESSLDEKNELIHLLLPKKEDNNDDPFSFMEDSTGKKDVKGSNPLPVSDLLEKMKLSFQSQSYGEEEDSEESCDEVNEEETVNKNFLSNEVYDRVYRGLPYAAYIKNRNMKTLLRRINTIAHTKDKSLKSISRSNSSVSDDDDDDIYSSSDLDEESENEEEPQNLLIPMENGWVCEKKWEEERNQYSTFFWSPDGLQHSSLAIIRFYGEKKNLNLNMDLFTRAVDNNPPPPPPS